MRRREKAVLEAALLGSVAVRVCAKKWNERIARHASHVITLSATSESD